MLELPNPAFFAQVTEHLFVAMICGSLIGLERQLRGKSVGIRPCVIVVLTVSFIVDLGSETTLAAGDPSRVIAAVVTGVGFLGAGVILAQGLRIRGITTASLIWALSAIGIAIGLGFAWSAFAFTVTIMAVMLMTDLAELAIPALRRNSPLRKDE